MGMWKEPQQIEAITMVEASNFILRFHFPPVYSSHMSTIPEHLLLLKLPCGQNSHKTAQKCREVCQKMDALTDSGPCGDGQSTKTSFRAINITS